jgi:N-acetylglucosamine-6-sulfatase
MMARARAALVLVCLLVSTSLSPAPTATAVVTNPPNFVVIVVDDLDSASVAHMPAVEQNLVDQGASFSRFFATTPLCCPSRASILRGQYAHNHGVLRNTGDDAGFDAFIATGHQTTTLATLMDDAGYQTALIGKYLNGYAHRDDQTYVPPGWDFWAAGVGHDAYAGFRYELNVNGEVVRYGNDDSDYMTDVLAGYAHEFLASATSSSAPFLLYLAPYAPHSPSTPAPRHRGSFAGARAPRTPSFNEHTVKDKPDWIRDTPRMSDTKIQRVDTNYRRRLESLLAVDEMVDAVMQQLEQAGVLETTYLVFLSDNGYFLGEHRQPHGKDAPYDAASRVPLVVRGPGIPAASRVDSVALNIDLMPTVLDLAGLTAPSFVDGRSIAPIARGDDRDWRQAALLEGFGKETESLEGTESSTPPYQALRGEDLLYTEYETGERELYDLRKDPYELSNLARGAEQSLLRSLSRRLQALASCASQECREFENAPLPRISGHDNGRQRGAKKEHARHERQRSDRGAQQETPQTRSTDQVLQIRAGAQTPETLHFALSRRDAAAKQLWLRVHVDSVETPGTLVASVELPGDGGRERLSNANVRRSGWLTLEVSAALGDMRQITIGLRGRDGAVLSISAPGSSKAPALVSERSQRIGDAGQEPDRSERRSRADQQHDDGRHRDRTKERRRGR